jgi:hypothetical protein
MEGGCTERMKNKKKNPKHVFCLLSLYVCLHPTRSMHLILFHIQRRRNIYIYSYSYACSSDIVCRDGNSGSGFG